jgi:hypothetical protein
LPREAPLDEGAPGDDGDEDVSDEEEPSASYVETSSDGDGEINGKGGRNWEADVVETTAMHTYTGKK